METEYTEKKVYGAREWVSEWEWKNNNKKVLIFFVIFSSHKKMIFFL